MTTRREFLQTSFATATVVSLGGHVPLFLAEAAAASSNENDHILVLVQLSGGNDGLNTVIPYGDDQYYRNRFTLATGKSQVRQIDDYLGFHPALEQVSQLLAEGKLAVAQGVGYPHPNRSHFESMDLWHTAHRARDHRDIGWLGRFLDETRGDAATTATALHLGAEKQPLALAALHAVVPSIQSLERFRLLARSDNKLAVTMERMAAVPRDASDELLQFIGHTNRAALATSAKIEQTLGDYQSKVEYPGTGLSGKLRSIAQMITSGLDSRIYYVTLDGFDTHANQLQAHAGLLREFDGALGAFLTDLTDKRLDQRVTVVAFSEFGRRVRENASGGTDHGAAAPVLIAGGALKGGVLGEHPDLQDLDDGDLKFAIDYRRIYATLLEDWLDWPSDRILGGRYEKLPLFA